MPSRTGYHTVKVRAGGFERLNRIVAAVAQHGWAVLGVTRVERVSDLNVMEVALELLEKRLKKKH